jgi:hypothetical protein
LLDCFIQGEQAQAANSLPQPYYQLIIDYGACANTMAGEEFDDSDLPEPSLKNILEQESLQWVFVGGEFLVAWQLSFCGEE